MSKTGKYKNVYAEYSNNISNAMLSFILFNVLGVIIIMLVTGGLPGQNAEGLARTLWLTTTTEGFIAQILIIGGYFVLVNALVVYAYILTLPANKVFYRKKNVVIKDKNRAATRSTTAVFYTSDDKLIFGDVKSYFRIEVGKKYKVTLDKNNDLGEYNLVEETRLPEP